MALKELEIMNPSSARSRIKMPTHDHERVQPYAFDQDHAGAHKNARVHDSASGTCCSPAISVSATDSTVSTLNRGNRSAIRIMQMDCPTEESLIRDKLAGLTVVRAMEFNLMQRVLTVGHAPDALEPILQAVRTLGFKPEVVVFGESPQADEEPARSWWPLALAGVAALAPKPSLVEPREWLAAALAILAVIACGLTTYKKGWVAIRNGNLNINALMSIAVTGALVLQQWPEAAMVMVLFTLPS